MRKVLCAFCAVIFLSISGEAFAQLRASVTKVDITPEEPVYMAGYDARTSPAAGVFDPLYARVLVLECGGQKMAYVTADLCWFPTERVAREAKARWGYGLVLTGAIHSHAAPDFLYTAQWKNDARWQAQLRRIEDLVLGAIERAQSNMFPAQLTAARGEIALGYNRLVMQPSGRRVPVFQNFNRIPYGPVDPRMEILRIEDRDAGTTRAILVNYACHATCMGGRNLKMSADWPGAMTAKVETTLPGTICLFAQGGAGCTNPLFQGAPSDPENEWKRAQTMGGLAADEVLRAIRGARPVEGPDELQWRSHTRRFENRWPDSTRDNWLTTGPLEIAAATVMLNRAVGIMAIPGEPLLELQLAFKREAPVEHPFFFGYTTVGQRRWPEYIPDVRSAAEGGYGGDRRTFIEIGGGERLVNDALIDLYWMKGMLRDKPGK
jgi:hypothetical protein